MSLIFGDTVGFLALWNKRDQWHPDATDAFGRLSDNDEVITTTSVLLECGNAAARTSFRQEVDFLRMELESSQGLISPTEEEWQEAWRAYRAGEAGRAGIVDHLSFLVMRRLGIQRAFTNDQHFRTAGFELLF